MNKAAWFIGLSVLLIVLVVTDLAAGAVWITPLELFSNNDNLLRHILLNLRLPKTLTAVMAGTALSISGLMMQTLFRNPLAGPYILGVSSGSSLGVAIIVLLGSLIGFTASGSVTILAAVMASALVLLLVLWIARRVQSNVSLLIIGMMIGSIAGALVSLLQSIANPDALKLFIVWTLGSLSSVGWSELPILATVFASGLMISVLLVKPLNGLLLGENYALSLGVNVKRLRFWIVIATGLLAGGITAFCGPIAFVGVAVPHIARGIFKTSDHRLTLAGSALIGANLLVVCDILASLSTTALPISTLSSLFGAPVIIWILVKGHKT